MKGLIKPSILEATQEEKIEYLSGIGVQVQPVLKAVVPIDFINGHPVGVEYMDIDEAYRRYNNRQSYIDQLKDSKG